MSVSHCPVCFVLTWDADVCRHCGAAPEAPLPPPPPPAAPLPRMTRRPPGVRPLVTPALLLACAALIAAGWQPLVHEFALVSATGGDVRTELRIRGEELAGACASLLGLRDELERSLPPLNMPLSEDWKARLDALASRHRLRSESGGRLLAPAEVAIHAAVLELESLHSRRVTGGEPGDALRRLHTTGQELSRVAEDLSHDN